MKALTPAERLQHVISFTNHYITETHGDANMLFSTVFIGIFNHQNGTLTYMNCGNEPPLLLGKEGAVTALLPTGPVVGVIPDVRFSVKEIPMEINDLLLAFTDGIPDALNMDNISFGNERLQKLLSSDEKTPKALLNNIADQLHQFTGDTDQFDDITILAVKRVP